jgi:hypothetical protein
MLHLVRARAIRILAAPLVQDDGSESIYFTVPSGFAPQPILQATFEPDHAPSRDDFEMLEAAAVVAAQIL